MRILHLIDPGSPGGGACTLRLLAEVTERITSARHDVLVVGTSAHVAVARGCGVEPLGAVLPPGRATALAVPALRAWLDEAERTTGPYDLIHAWTADAALLATLVRGDARRLATLSVGPVSGLLMHGLALALEQNPMPMLTATAGVRGEYHAMGIPRDATSILPPAVNPVRIDAAPDRGALRQRWEVGDGTFVVGLLAEPLRWSDARLGAWLGAFVEETGRPVRVVVHPLAGRRTEGQRWLRTLGLERVLILEDDVAEPWRIVGGLDAALVVGDEASSLDLRQSGSPFAFLLGGGRLVRPMPGIMPMLWAMAAGVPVIAENSYSVRGIIDEGVNGLLVRDRDVNQAANRVMRLIDDPTIAARIGIAARETVSMRFHVSAYCVRLKEAYERALADRPVFVASSENQPLIERFERETSGWTTG